MEEALNPMYEHEFAGLLELSIVKISQIIISTKRKFDPDHFNLLYEKSHQ
jgi:hypothetical protein